ncbi:hypothetical protein LCGC14_3086930 [marine sediment metagenome]|uniref:Uncharacterized protein n=1 Tax=marine sediment metagenome TaxID=412755 RepID=A0A0F8X098_9ZZZZ
MSSMELTFAKQEIEDLKQAGLLQRSATLTLLLDLQVMLEDGDYDEALEFIKGHVE